MTGSELLYAVALVFYMQAMPTKLVCISAAVNIIVILYKLWEAN